MQLSNLLNTILQKTHVNSLIFLRGRNRHRRTIYNSSIHNQDLTTRIKSILERFFNNLNNQQPEISKPIKKL
jgi:hypothetical protein